MKSKRILWRTLLDDLWVYLGVAVGLTAIIGWEGTVEQISVNFVANLVVSLCIGVLIGAGFSLVERYEGTTLARGALMVAVCIGAILLGVDVALRVVDYFFAEAAPRFPRWTVIRVAIPVTVAIVLVNLAFERVRRRAEEAENQRLRSELQALQARVNPHFLFNSLNAIAALIGEDPERAEDGVVKLSQLFRYTLEGSKELLVPVSREVAAARAYLEFEALRFGPRLSVSVDVEDGLDDLEIPPMIIQPLAENAVLHGVSNRREGGSVRIRLHREPGHLVLSVDDDGPGPGGSTQAGAGTTHANLQDRLRLAYGNRARFSTSVSELGGYGVRVMIPEPS